MKQYIIISTVFFIAFLGMSTTLAFIVSTEEQPVIIENVDPPSFVEIQGEKIKLDGIEGFTIDEWEKAGGGSVYVLRTLGRVYEIPFDNRSDAEDAGIYICMMKGNRL